MGRRKTPFLNSCSELFIGFIMLLMSVGYSALRSLCDAGPNFCTPGHLKSGFFKNCLSQLSVSVACSASFKFVQCIANFALCASLEKSIFQELLETAQTIGFITLVVPQAYSAGFWLCSMRTIMFSQCVAV